MEEEEDLNESLALTIIYYIFSIIMTVFSVLLIIIYSKNKYLQMDTQNVNIINQKFLSYFNIFFCIMVISSNIIRLIPESLTVNPSKEKQSSNTLCVIQAFTCCLLDKILISLMTNYSIINYLSMFHSVFYQKNLKKIFISLITIGFILSLILSIIFILEGISYKDVLCSIHTRTTLKKVADSFFTSFLLIINILSLGRLILYLYKLSKKYEGENPTQYEKSIRHLYRYLVDMIFTVIAFVYTLLVINKAFPRGSYKDFIYISICLIVELIFTINKFLFKAFVRLVTCGKYYKIKDFEPNENESRETSNNLEENLNPSTL